MFLKQRLHRLEVHSWVFTEEMTWLTFVLKYRSPLLPQSGWVVGIEENQNRQNVDHC